MKSPAVKILPLADLLLAPVVYLAASSFESYQTSWYWENALLQTRLNARRGIPNSQPLL